MSKAQYAFSVEANGNIFSRRLSRSNVVQEIPPGVYVVRFNPDDGFYLAPTEQEKRPEKVYGDPNKLVNRFFRSYELNNKNLGVLLVGDRGCGKSLTLHLTELKAIELGMIVLRINFPFSGDEFVEFINSIKQPAVVSLDEFEKTYTEDNPHNPHGRMLNRAAHTTLLRLLDGSSKGAKKLYVKTSNELNHPVMEFLTGRPSRVRYIVEYKGLDHATIIDYVATNVKEKQEETVAAFLHYVRGLHLKMTFDILSELVKEMQHFDEDLDEVIKFIDMGSMDARYYSVSVYKDNVHIDDAVAHSAGKTNYCQKDDFKIYLRSQNTDVNGVMLNGSDFVSYGDEHGNLHYQKNGHDFFVKYISGPQHTTEIERIFGSNKGGEKEKEPDQKDVVLTTGSMQHLKHEQSGLSVVPWRVSELNTPVKVVNSSLSGAHVSGDPQQYQFRPGR